MTPLIKSLVALAPEAAEYIWFDIGMLPAFSFSDCWVGDASIGMVFKDYEVKTC